MVTARKFRCTWPVLLFKDIRTVQVTVTGQVAGDYTNTAFVKSSSGDLDDNNNQDSDTLQVKVSLGRDILGHSGSGNTLTEQRKHVLLQVLCGSLSQDLG
jgi:hypothetical protein